MADFGTDFQNFQHDAQQFLDAGEDLLNIVNDPPNVRFGAGISNRDKQVMTWRLPGGNTVQMYINPENFVTSDRKSIVPTRTKGGFVVQYWGEELTKLSLRGTTGSSGIKGIQVLRDIYRAENNAFELVAATQTSEFLQRASESGLNTANLAQTFATLSDELRQSNFLLRPSLASLALSVNLFYQGIQYKGFFTEFTVTESVEALGMFDYDLEFTATEMRGSRENFMPWHKEPLGDDLAGQLISGTLNYVGNAIRSFTGQPSQAQTPTQFHPENAPLTFGGNSLASTIGL